MDKKKIIVSVYLSNGQSWTSSTLELDQKKYSKLLEVAENLSIGISEPLPIMLPIVDGLNRKSTMYFNPAHVSAIQLVDA
jgi:hypothetical protein